MDVLQAIAERRAVREFTGALISQEVMRDLIDSAILAPSARNLQPWSFAVVLDRDRIEGHAQNAKEWLLANQTPELGLPSRYQVVAPIIVGHPKAWPDPQERSVPEINWLDG